MACISKTAGRRAQGSEVWTLATHIWGTFDHVEFKVILGVIQYTCLKIACISKTSGRTAKRREIWESRTLVIHI